jgi:hypothetical protein
MLKQVFDLRLATDYVAAVQRATLETEDFGLVPEPALYGSAAWWEAIEEGTIPVQQVEGTIARVFMSGHNDWPEFEVDNEGGLTRWTREGDDSCYEVGRRVRVEYVEQRFKKLLAGVGPMSKCVIAIWIDCQ